MATIDIENQAAADEVWREFESSLRAFVRRRIADPHRADDIVGDVFLRIHEKLHTVDDDERLASWVFAIARNAVTDEYRRAGRRKEELFASPAEDVSSPAAVDDPAILQELAGCLRPLLARIPPQHRRAIEMADLEGITQAEAARREGISVSGMKSRVQRGRRELREVLTTCCAFTLDARGLPLEYASSENSCGCADGGCDV